MNNTLKHGFFEVTFVGDLDKCLSQKELLSEEYNQLCLKIQKIEKRNKKVKLIAVLIGSISFILFSIGVLLQMFSLTVVSSICLIICFVVLKVFCTRRDLFHYVMYPAGVSRIEYEYYKNGLSYYLKDKMGNKLQIYEALKNNMVRGVTFRFNSMAKNKWDIIFCIENSDRIVSNVNLDSVTVRQSLEKRYKNKIELNIEKNFEITYFYYDESPIRWKGV